MGLGSEEWPPTGTFEVKKGKVGIFGGQEGLPKRFLELTLNEQGNLRVKRLGGINQVDVWGLDKKRGSKWEKFHLVQELADKQYEKIDGRSVIIDIAVPTRNEQSRLLRLNEEGRSDNSRLYRAHVNPEDRDLTQSN